MTNNITNKVNKNTEIQEFAKFLLMQGAITARTGLVKVIRLSILGQE